MVMVGIIESYDLSIQNVPACLDSHTLALLCARPASGDICTTGDFSEAAADSSDGLRKTRKQMVFVGVVTPKVNVFEVRFTSAKWNIRSLKANKQKDRLAEQGHNSGRELGLSRQPWSRPNTSNSLGSRLDSRRSILYYGLRIYDSGPGKPTSESFLASKTRVQEFTRSSNGLCLPQACFSEKCRCNML